jgi:hypothetical protein
MRRFIQIVFFSLLSVTSFSQSLADNLEGILNLIGNNIPADEVFLHLDRNLYHSGDTIRFQAYIRDYQTGVFETGSLSLHVLLLNANHVTIDSARFRISYSTASGWLKVPDSASVGDYSILAFTSGQMNYDPEFAFRMPLRVDLIKPDRKPKLSDTLIRSADADLRFLPEGGTFINGIRQRLAFNAVSADGKILKASGKIVKLNGEIVTDFGSGPYGPGIVEFTPQPGESYYAKPSEKEFGNISWPLPVAEDTGISLRVDNPGNGLTDIIVRGREVTGKEYFLTVTMYNVLIFSKEIRPDTLFTARIKTADIPAGTAFVTLCDTDLNPVAERVIFLNHNNKMKVEISVSPGEARPGRETELTVNTTDGAGNNVSSVISISALDSASGYHSGIPFPDIETEFLYDREIYNNLPNNIRCMGIKNIDSKSVDLLLMTYGWRKYNLKEYVSEGKQPVMNDYDHIRITSPGTARNGRSSVTLLSPEGGREFTIELDTNREALLSFDSLDVFARQILILPDEKAALNSNAVNVEFPGNPDFTEKAKSVSADSFFDNPDFEEPVSEGTLFNPDSAVMIEPVTIKGKREKPAQYADKNAERFKYAGTYTLTNKDFKGAASFEDIIPFFHPTLVRNRKIYLSSRRFYDWKIGGDPVVLRPALVVVDDVPIYGKTYDPIARMPAHEIASVTIIRGVQGYSLYGNDASNGVILVTTKTGNRINGIFDPDDEFNQSNDLLKQVRVFRTEVEYYTPSKEQIELVPEYQFRPTLLWRSDVYLDGTGPVKIEYPNNMGKGTVIVFVNGVSLTNQIGSGRGSYSIR